MEQHVVSTGGLPYFEPLLTASEAAVHLRCHVSTVRHMAKEGRMPCIRRGERFFFRLSELDDWLRGMHTQPQPTLRVN